MGIHIKSPEEYLAGIREKITVQEIRAFFIVFLAGICLYMPMIMYRLNCSDGNVCGIIYRQHRDYDIEDIAGRYLLKYAAHLKSMFVFRWLAVILGLLFLAVAAIFLCRILKLRSMLSITIAGLFVMFSPCFTETFTYGFVAEVYVLCFLLNVLAVYLLFEKQTWVRCVFATGLMFVSLAFYQSYLFVAVVLFMFVLLEELLENKSSFREIGKKLLWWMGSGISAVAVYVIMNKVLKMVGLIYYQESRFDFLELLSPSRLPGAILSAYQNFYAYFFTMDIINNGWKARWLLNGIFILIGAVLLLTAVIREKRGWKNITAIAVVLLLLPIAFMGVGILYDAYIMVLPTVCLLYVGIWALWIKERKAAGNIQKLCGWMLYACTFYLLFIMGTYVAIYQLCMKYYADKTDSMAQRIIVRIEEEYPETVAGSPVFICGDVDEGNYPQDYWITQASYIMKGTNACEGMFLNNMQGYFAGWNQYLAYNFGVEYTMIWDRAEEIYHSEFYEEMPLWPAEGSVDKTEDGIVVVKLKN